jgi:hypothetical protein
MTTRSLSLSCSNRKKKKLCDGSKLVVVALSVAKIQKKKNVSNKKTTKEKDDNH